MPSRFNRRKRRPRRRRRKMPIVKLIKKVIQSSSEHKYVTVNFETTSVTGVNPVFQPLNIVAQGTNVSNRIGIIVKGSRLKVRFGIEQADSGASSSVRVYLIQSMTDDDPSAMPSIAGLMPPLQDSNVSYRILYDRTFQFGLGLNRNVFRTINISRKKMIDIRWGSTTSDDFTKGKINLHVATNNQTVDEISWQHIARFYYTDE